MPLKTYRRANVLNPPLEYGACFFLHIQYVVAYTCRIAFMVSLVFFLEKNVR